MCRSPVSAGAPSSFAACRAPPQHSAPLLPPLPPRAAARLRPQQPHLLPPLPHLPPAWHRVARGRRWSVPAHGRHHRCHRAPALRRRRRRRQGRPLGLQGPAWRRAEHERRWADPVHARCRRAPAPRRRRRRRRQGWLPGLRGAAWRRAAHGRHGRRWTVPARRRRCRRARRHRRHPPRSLGYERRGGGVTSQSHACGAPARPRWSQPTRPALSAARHGAIGREETWAAWTAWSAWEGMAFGGKGTERARGACGAIGWHVRGRRVGAHLLRRRHALVHHVAH